MKPLFRCACLAVSLVFFMCGYQYPLIKGNEENRAELYKGYCQEKKTASPESKAADRLFDQAMVARQNGQKQEAAYLMDQALVTYRMALLKQELEEWKKTRKELELSLNRDTEQLEYYQRLLDDLKEMREGQ